jgi:hypothetical protein
MTVGRAELGHVSILWRVLLVLDRVSRWKAKSVLIKFRLYTWTTSEVGCDAMAILAPLS